MKKLFKLLFILALASGWALAASALYLVRGPGRVAGIPHTESIGRWALIPKDCLGWRDTFVDTSHWTLEDLARHPVVAQRIRESGKKYLISHITETGLTDASPPAAVVEVKPVAAVETTPVTPQAAPQPQEKSIFDFPDKK